MVFAWPAGLTAFYERAFFQRSYALNRAWQEVPGSVAVGLIDTIKTRVLRLALELKDELGGVHDDDDLTELPKEKVDQTVINIIYGGTNVIASQNFSPKLPSGNRDGLQIRAEGEKTAVTVPHYKTARFPRRVGESPRELHSLGCVLSIQRVRIFDVKVGVEQFVRILIGIGCWRLGAAEMNRVLVAFNDGVYRRMLPRAQTFEAKLVLVIGESGRNVSSEELRRDLTDHEPSLVQIPAGPADAPAKRRYRKTGARSPSRRLYHKGFMLNAP
jgi:hypothetical protein